MLSFQKGERVKVVPLDGATGTVEGPGTQAGTISVALDDIEQFDIREGYDTWDFPPGDIQKTARRPYQPKQ